MSVYKDLFRQHWTPLTGGIIIGFVNTLMFMWESPWTVFTGLRNWGLHILELAGVGDVAQISPLEQTTSVMNIAFLLGAFASALLAGQFAVRIPPLREAIKGIVGGALMGLGANFSRGCTVGGFYSSIASMSASGLFMMLGLIIGVVIGYKYLLYEKRRMGGPSGGGKIINIPRLAQIVAGALALIMAIVMIPHYYYDSDFGDGETLSLIFLFAAIIGIANRQSRFCVVRAFRDPMMTGDGEMTKALIASFIVVIGGFAMIKYNEIQDVTHHINPSFWYPALIGGVIFGVGMTIAGGCASGSLWRAGEGQVKLALATFSFAISAAATHLVLQLKFEYSYIGRLFLPDKYGWVGALGLLFAIMFVWYTIVSWNEKTEKLVINK